MTPNRQTVCSLRRGRAYLRLIRGRALRKIRLIKAHFWQKWYGLRNRLSKHFLRYRVIAPLAAVIIWILVSLYLSPSLQKWVEPFFDDEKRLEALRTVFVTLGGALIGATAIAFSLIMFALQVNVERVPHGLFHKLSSDRPLMSAFGGTFLLSIAITCASLIPSKAWASASLLSVGWMILLVFILLLYAYRRALSLINPIKQLSILTRDAIREMNVWVKGAKRAAPLFKVGKDKNLRGINLDYDAERHAYFQLYPQWVNGATRAIQYAHSFTRRYAEQGDYEMSGAALSAVIVINQGYINCRGKTFFSDNPFIQNPLSRDGFTNNTLEQLRQNIQAGIARGDEQQIEQTLRTFRDLVALYLQINYVQEHSSKTHAHLAAGYLSEAVQSVIPHNMADVMMEGVRLMGQTGQLFLRHDESRHITPLADKIGLICCVGALNEKYRPVSLTGMEQLAVLMFELLRMKERDISFAVKNLRKNISTTAQLFLEVKELPLQSPCSSNLAPYYSLTSTQTFLSWLTDLVNQLANEEKDSEDGITVIRNIEHWADGLYQEQKELLLKAIQKKSHFTFDVIHWIGHATKLLLAVSNVPACPDYLQDKLKKHALYLTYTLSWIPKDDKDTVAFLENYQMTETLFEVAEDAYYREFQEISTEVEGMLLKWAIEAGRHQIGWAILERSLCGLAVLSLLNGTDLKRNLTVALTQEHVPNQDMRNSTARNILERATQVYHDRYSLSRMEHAMGQADQTQFRMLLKEIAEILKGEAS